MILDNRRITIREVADDVSISFGSCQAIFMEFAKLQNFEQKQRRMDIAQEILMTVNDKPEYLKKIITGDESWVYSYDIETKAQSSQWKACCYDRGDKKN